MTSKLNAKVSTGIVPSNPKPSSVQPSGNPPVSDDEILAFLDALDTALATGDASSLEAMAASGAAIGAAAASVIPGLGTVAGAAIGAALGIVAGLLDDSGLFKPGDASPREYTEIVSDWIADNATPPQRLRSTPQNTVGVIRVRAWLQLITAMPQVARQISDRYGWEVPDPMKGAPEWVTNQLVGAPDVGANLWSAYVSRWERRAARAERETEDDAGESTEGNMSVGLAFGAFFVVGGLAAVALIWRWLTGTRG